MLCGIYKATAESKPPVRISFINNCLTVQGLLLRVITKKAFEVDRNEEEASEYRHLASVYTGLKALHQDNSNSSTENFHSIASRILTGSRTFFYDPVELTERNPLSNGEVFRRVRYDAAFKALVDFLERHIAGEDTSSEEAWAPMNDFKRVAATAIQVCNRRTAFRIDNGCLGLGPEELAVGDVVGLLFGATVPFVLRRFKTAYRLVGAAYVQGVMAGEGMELWRTRKIQTVIFDIF